MNNEHTVAPTNLEKLKGEARKRIVDRFLGWRLPKEFHPDAGISFEPGFNKHLPTSMRHEPSGTNLFDATQAMEMVQTIVGDELEKAFSAGKEEAVGETVRFIQQHSEKVTPQLWYVAQSCFDEVSNFFSARTTNH